MSRFARDALITYGQLTKLLQDEKNDLIPPTLSDVHLGTPFDYVFGGLAAVAMPPTTGWPQGSITRAGIAMLALGESMTGTDQAIASRLSPKR